MTGFFVLQLFTPPSQSGLLRHWFYFPIAVEMSWNLILLQPLLLIFILAVVILRWLRPVKKDAPPLDAEGLSRRRFVYLLAYGAAPATALGMGVHGSLTRDDLRVRHLTVPIAGLAPELEGFTLAHVSDLHSGVFCGPERLRLIADATNDLKAELIVITGDIVNRSMEEFPDAQQAMARMQAPRGVLLCEGNHDVMAGPGRVAQACADHGLPMLMSQTVTRPVEGKRLLIAGLPWTDRCPSSWIEALYPPRQEGDLRLLLVHHPDVFDTAGGVDLVLSGHTHGGQIMAGPVGLGPLFFKYWSGLYRQGPSTLVVSNGCGDWFPCRIGAPAEIGLLRLTRAV
jgi:predicted MPP superfamily phosphohydrolase